MSEDNNKPQDPERRDFVVLTASATAALGTATAVVPLVSSLNPSADIMAQATIEVDLAKVNPGQTIKVSWQGKPIFIKHLTDKELQEAEQTEISALRDPEKLMDRVKEDHKKWLVMVGICTHLGCVPVADSGEYDGLFCPCHGSHYDVLGRIRKGPAPKNLPIPKYEFISESKIRIG